ncbi:MAG: CPBP family intramembrane glutamic endopeptidase [Sandaracinus sp.]
MHTARDALGPSECAFVPRRLGLTQIVGLLVLGRALLYVTVLVFVGIAIATRGIDAARAWQLVLGDPLPLGAAQLAALTAVIVLGTSLVPGEVEPARTLGLERVPSRELVLALLAGLGLQLPMVQLTTWLVHALPFLARPAEVDAAIEAVTRMSSPLRALTVPLSFIVIPALTEELLFRGLVQRSLRERFGPRAAIGITAVLFGAFHMDAQALFFASTMGVLLGVLAERSGSTLPGVALHAGFNALPVLLPRDLVVIAGFNDGSDADLPLGWALGSTLFALAALVGLFVLVGRRPPAEEHEP